MNSDKNDKFLFMKYAVFHVYETRNFSTYGEYKIPAELMENSSQLQVVLDVMAHKPTVFSYESCSLSLCVLLH
jgi:hypothetical protein